MLARPRRRALAGDPHRRPCPQLWIVLGRNRWRWPR